VPYDRSLRHEVREMTGQELTPVLVDGDVVVNDSRRAVAYLYETYGNARQHERAQELRDEIKATASAGDGKG
jgi:glutathione S-transferase